MATGYSIIKTIRRAAFRALPRWCHSIHLPNKDRAKHLYITGKTGSGKSELLKIIFNQLVSERKRGFRNSIIVMDPHGDLAAEIIRQRQLYNIMDDVIYIDPFLEPGSTPVFNPFMCSIPKGYREKQAEELARVIASTVRESGLSMQMTTLLTPCIAALLRKKSASLRDLQIMMLDEQNKELIEAAQLAAPQEHSNFFAEKFHSPAFGVTKNAIYTRLQSLLNSSVFANLTIGSNTFDLGKAINGGKIVIFNLSKGKLGSDTSEAFGKLILAMLHVCAMARASMDKRWRIPTYCIIDEFHNYITDSLELILTEDRKFGLHLVMASQTVGQNLGSQLTNIVLSNTGIKIAGANNKRSIDIMARETGAPSEVIQKLRTGHFYIKSGEMDGYVYKAGKKFVGHSNQMSGAQFAHMMEYQKDEYYRAIPTPERVAPKFTLS